MKQSLTILLSFIVIFLNAQNSNFKTDSLKSELLKSHGKEWVDLANQLSNEYKTTDLDYSFRLIDDAIKLSKGIGYIEGELKSLFTKGRLYYSKDEYESAILVFQETAKRYKEMNLFSKMAESIDYLCYCLMDIQEYEETKLLINSTLTNYYDSISPFVKSSLYSQLSAAYRQTGYTDKAITAIDTAIVIEKKHHLNNNLSVSYNTLGIIYSEIGEHKKSLHYYDLSELSSIASDDTLGIAYAIFNKALIYFDWGIYEESLKLISEASELFKNMNREYENVNTSATIALIYHEMDKLDLAKKYYFKAIRQAEFYNDQESKFIVFHNLGELYFLENQYDSALYYYSGSIKYDMETGNELGIAESKNALGTLFIILGKYNDAFKYFKEAENIFTKYESKQGLADLYSEIAYGYQKINNDSLSILFFNKSIRVFKELGNKKALMNTYKKASENFERLGILKESLSYYKSYKQYNDSIFNEKSSSAIEFMVIKLENQEQDRELHKLEAEKKLFKLQSKNKTIYFSAAIIILLLLVTLYLWRYILKRKSEQKLSIQYNILLDTEEKIKALLDASFDSTLLVDNNYLILTANNNSLNGFFKNPDQLTSQNILNLFTKANQDTLIHFLALVAQTKLSKEFVLLEKNDIQLNIRISPVIDSNKKITTLALYIKDITLIEKAKSDQIRMQKKLIQTQKMETIGTLAGGIAHDFNNYLATISGYVNMLLEDADKSSHSYKYLTNSNKALKHAHNTVKKLLAFSRTNELTFATTTLNELFNDSLDMVKGLKPKNIELLHPKLIPDYTLFIDANQITQVIINICTNAFHAIENDPNGKLEFIFSDYEKQEDMTVIKMIKIQIKDNGIGMDQATARRVFEPFFTTKEVGKGTGLGLSVASGIIKQHNGEISVISKYKEGSTISISLPLKTKTN